MSKVPKASLELDEDYHPGHSVADAAAAEGVEEERCVVSQYRTTYEQREDFLQLLSSSERERIPVEWVIDIADESDGWFYATAYGYNDITHMLYVMVPDKENPTFEGEVQLDHRTVHLLECVDGASLALFNKIVRDSLIKVRWDVEWFDEEVNELGEPVEGGTGQWLQTSARYLVRLANQVLVQDRESGSEDGHGWVMVIADENLRLIKCHKNKGIEDFYRLVLEGNVLSSPEVYEEAQRFMENEKEAREREQEEAERGGGGGEHERDYERDYDRDRSHERVRERDESRDRERERDRESSSTRGTSSSSSSTRKLAEYARSLRENLEDIIEERDMKKRDDREIAELFHSFILNGDLDQGAQLMHHFGKIRDNRHAVDEDEERIETIMDDAKHMATKLQRSLTKFARSGSGEDKQPDDAEKLRVLVKKLEKEVKELKIRR